MVLPTYASKYVFKITILVILIERNVDAIVVSLYKPSFSGHLSFQSCTIVDFLIAVKVFLVIKVKAFKMKTKLYLCVVFSS